MEKLGLFLGAHVAIFFIVIGIVWLFNKQLIAKRWKTAKYFIWEFVKMYSGQPSFFAKKRIESGIAFVILQWGMIYYLVHMMHLEKMDTAGMVMWSGVEATIAGWMINQIQKEKKTEIKPENKND